ncbi:MAG: cation transporter [Deltaproteobacteria bacterium]|nr:cation transporter [Deltaproteobacteria bacterium]
MVYTNEIKKVLWLTLLLNLFIAVIKIFYGYLTGLNSMQADGFHSLFDGMSNVIGLIGTWLAARPPDIKHHYGHKKFETMATIGIATLLFLTCFEIFTRAVAGFWNHPHYTITNMSFIIITATMGVNIFAAIYEYRKGKEFKSDFLIADAKHTLSDLFASIAVLISLIAVKIGYPIVDPISAILIAIMIGRLGYSIVKEASDVLLDASPLIDKDISRIEDIAMSQNGVEKCYNIRARGRADAVYIDCCLLVSPEMSIGDAHKAATIVEQRIKAEVANVVDVVVHIEPLDA